ncbi:MAG: type II 3-dehydroquinate dehydratase [Paramuribaculum sp.]|nr:type II 3-dehydroquinate dehydratase [Paramuribaculum sp.]
MNLLIINGPNLNLLGRRRPEIYGATTLDEINAWLCDEFPGHRLEFAQSNHEGTIIDMIHEASGRVDGIVLNAGAYTHTSLAIADAIEAVEIPVVEVHISNVAAREPVRRHSMLAPVCAGTITGFGRDSYRLAIEALIRIKR